MFKVIANILLAGLAIALTIFTAARTLHLLSEWLPVDQETYKWLGLAAFEGGLYFWAFYFVVGGKGAIQRGVAFMMIVVCFVSVAVATVVDLVLVGAQDGKLPPIPMEQKQAIVIFVGVVIVLNVAAFLAAKLTHPDKLKEMAMQDAEDHIHAVNIAMIRQAAPSVASQAAPIMTDRWVADTWARMVPNAARPADGTVYGSVSYQQTAQLPASSPAPQLPAPRPSQRPDRVVVPESVAADDKPGIVDQIKQLFAGLGKKDSEDGSAGAAVPVVPAPAPTPMAAAASVPVAAAPGSGSRGSVTDRRKQRRDRMRAAASSQQQGGQAPANSFRP